MRSIFRGVNRLRRYDKTQPHSQHSSIVITISHTPEDASVQGEKRQELQLHEGVFTKDFGT